MNLSKYPNRERVGVYIFPIGFDFQKTTYIFPIGLDFQKPTYIFPIGFDFQKPTFQTRPGLCDPMMPADLTSLDSEVLDSTETPQQETPRTCTRQTPCTKPTCYTCASPSDGNHVRNLTTALNTTTSTASVNPCPAPPTNHWISKLTQFLQEADLTNDVRDLNHLNAIYDRCMINEPDVLDFD